MLKLVGWQFEAAQAIATVVAMVFNFQLNNEITYRDQRLRGPRLWRGLLLFMLVCGLGAVANIGIAKTLYRYPHQLDDRRRDRRGDRRGVELRRVGDAGLARTIIRHPEARGGKAIPGAMSISRWALVALIALTLLRLVVAASVPLAPDEAYYWVWSRALAAGYPDHPPMVALWIRIGTTLAGDSALGVRLLGPCRRRDRLAAAGGRRRIACCRAAMPAFAPRRC